MTIKHSNAAQIAADLERQNIKLDARGEYLRLCPDILNPRAERELAARIVRAAI